MDIAQVLPTIRGDHDCQEVDPRVAPNALLLTRDQAWLGKTSPTPSRKGGHRARRARNMKFAARCESSHWAACGLRWGLARNQQRHALAGLSCCRDAAGQLLSLAAWFVRRLRSERGGDRHDGAKIPYPLLTNLKTDPGAWINAPRRSSEANERHGRDPRCPHAAWPRHAGGARKFLSPLLAQVLNALRPECFRRCASSCGGACGGGSSFAWGVSRARLRLSLLGPASLVSVAQDASETEPPSW